MQAIDNVILFLIDALRYDGINALEETDGTLGNLGVTENLETPNMDFFVEEGTVLPELHSPYGSTPPATSSVLTGSYPRENGCYAYYRPMRSNAKTLAEHFSSAGYHTLIWNGHFFFDPMGIRERFDEAGSGSIPRMLERLKALNQEGKKVFLYMHTMDVHSPYTMSKWPPDVDYHDRALELANEISEEVGFDRTFNRDDADEYVTEVSNEKRLYSSYESSPLWRFMADNVHRHYERDYSFEDPVQSLAQLYTIGINRFDKRQFSFMTDYLKAESDHETLFLLTSDHGESIQRRGEEERETFCHQGKPVEELIKVPGIVYPEPDCSAAISSHELTSLVDIAPTLLSLANVETSTDSFSGKNLTDGKRDEERLIYAEFSSSRTDLVETDDPSRDRVFPLPGILENQCVITSQGEKLYRPDVPFTEDDLGKPLDVFIRVAFSKILKGWIEEQTLEYFRNELRENDTRESRMEFVSDLRKKASNMDLDRKKELFYWRKDSFEKDNHLGEHSESRFKQLDTILAERFPDSIEVHMSFEPKVDQNKETDDVIDRLEGLGYL